MAIFLLIIDLIVLFHLSKIFSLTFTVILFKVRLHELRTEKYFYEFTGQLVVAQL